MRGKDTKRPDLAAPLLRWYARHGRDLPWRHTSDPYRILLSETMLQQTQVSRVLERYPVFLKRFPSFRSLARASRADVVRAWSGMGYNNRAVRLHELARRVAAEGGALSPDPAALGALPGVGEYTRSAVLAFAFRRRVPVVDVNVRRVLSRVFRRMPDTASLLPVPDVRVLAESLLPRRRHYDWNQALMDLGALVCTARAPRCGGCPLAAECSSQGRMHETRRKARNEPSLLGVPNRIYRGRLVEELRRARGAGGTAAGTLARRLVPGFSREHHAWFEGVLAGLAHDGVIRVRPGGPLEKRRVTLA